MKDCKNYEKRRKEGSIDELVIGEPYRVYYAVIPSCSLFILYEGMLKNFEINEGFLTKVTLEKATRYHCRGDPTEYGLLDIYLDEAPYDFKVLKGFEKK